MGRSKIKGPVVFAKRSFRGVFSVFRCFSPQKPLKKKAGLSDAPGDCRGEFLLDANSRVLYIYIWIWISNLFKAWLFFVVEM